MKCKDCESCKKGWFKSKPEKYVCIGVKEPFVIENINVECTEYPDKRQKRTNEIKNIRFKGEDYIPYVGDDGIYAPVVYNGLVYNQCVVPKTLFVEAYNKWIKEGQENEPN
jgi:hypothetical protein